ncbi:MAG: hypothetical protein PHI79_08420, partial [Sulfurovaceae bacterium]|nr:hypothetical protein [Sulfurovaceae bacterium]
KNISDRFCKSLNDDCCVYLGYVARERKRMHDSDKKYITNKYPLVDWDWNENEVSNYLKDKTLYNKLYDHFTRTGCKFCPKQSRDSWFALYSYHRDDWNIAKSWEQRATKDDAVIKTFVQNLPLEVLEQKFEQRLKRLQNTPQFQLNWNDQDVSCMCK